MSRTIPKTKTKCSNCGKLIYKHGYQVRKFKDCFCNFKCKGEWTSKNCIEDKSYNWKGGSYSKTAQRLCNSRYRNLRKKFLDANENKCYFCSSNQNLHVHHIESKTSSLDALYDVSNWLLLCRDCHIKLHDLFNGVREKVANSVDPETDDAVGNTELSGKKPKCVETIYHPRKR